MVRASTLLSLHVRGRATSPSAPHAPRRWSGARLGRALTTIISPLAGIKKPKPQKYRSNKGVDPKFLRNQRYVKKGMEAKKE